MSFSYGRVDAEENGSTGQATRASNKKERAIRRMRWRTETPAKRREIGEIEEKRDGRQ